MSIFCSETQENQAIEHNRPITLKIMIVSQVEGEVRGCLILEAERDFQGGVRRLRTRGNGTRGL